MNREGWISCGLAMAAGLTLATAFARPAEAIDCPGNTRVTVTKAVATPPGPNVFSTLQAAVDAAGPGDVIGVFGPTFENVQIQPSSPLTITECSVGEITALDPSKPVIKVLGNVPVTIIGLRTLGGVDGFEIAGNGHLARSIRAARAARHGIAVTGNGNQVLQVKI